MTVLRFENVDASYADAHVLRSVALEVRRGERVALLGRNGVGKTTVANTVGGIARLRGGRVVMGDRSYARLHGYTASQAGVSIVPQGRRILPNLTVEENLLLGGASGRKGQWSLERIYALFPILRERRSSPGTALSGGQQQMLAIGRALMANPEILILDEPSEGLAPVVVDELATVFAKLAVEDGMGILLIEQMVSLVQRVATRFYILSKGSIVGEGLVGEWSRDELQKHIAV
jgi:branched-chain amino acid transport system ATP-binding protein